MQRLLILCLALVGCDCGDDSSVIVSGDGADPRDEGITAPRLAAPATLTHDSEAAAAVQSIALSPDGTRVAASGWDGRVVLLSLSGGSSTELHQLGGGDLFMEGAMAWAGDRIAVGTFSGLVLLDETGAVVAELDGRTRTVLSQGSGFIRTDRDGVERVAPDGSVLATAAIADPRSAAVTDDAVYVVGVPEGVDRVAHRLHPETLVEQARFAVDGDLVFASADGVLATPLLDTVTLRDPAGAPLGELEAFSSDIVALSFEGPWVAGLGFSANVALFDVASRQLLAQAGGQTGRGLVLDGDRRIIAGGAEGVLVYAIER